MAINLNIRLLILIVLSAIASARDLPNPRVFEFYQSPPKSSSSPLSNNGDEKVSARPMFSSETKPSRSPSPIISSEPEPSPTILGETKTSQSPSPIILSETGASQSRMSQSNIVQPSLMQAGLIPILPGVDGSFQFGPGRGSFDVGLGPIDFGFNWGQPGYVLGYNTQPNPYVVVSPYVTPFSLPPNQPPRNVYNTGRPLLVNAIPYYPSKASSGPMVQSQASMPPMPSQSLKN
ncbi:unnamed protein product [Amaranthus hypochondriacus]